MNDHDLEKITVSPDGGRTGGFTLIELLIAVAILAVLVTAIYATLFNVLGTREEVQAHMDRLREFRRFSAIFSREVRASYVNPSNSRSLWTGSGVKGSPHPMGSLSMTYFTYASGKPRSGDLMAVRYGAEETEDGITLYRESWNPYNGKEGIKAEVMEDIDGFNLSFFDGEKWVDSWDGAERKGPPMAVRASIDVRAVEGIKTLTTTALTMVR